MTREKQNVLDLIPTRNPAFSWEQDDAGIVTVDMVHRGVYDRIAQKIFHTPPVSHIALDAYGSFVWGLIDGERTVCDIGRQVGARFGSKAEPLYERLARFFQILKENRFVTMEKR